MADNIHDVNSLDEYKKMLEENKDKFVLVDFWAEWCGPCKAAEPVIEKIAEEKSDELMVLKVNIDDHRDIAQKYEVMSIPTMHLFASSEAVAENEAIENDQDKPVIFAEESETGRKFSMAVGFRPEPAMLQWMEATGMKMEDGE